MSDTIFELIWGVGLTAFGVAIVIFRKVVARGNLYAQKALLGRANKASGSAGPGLYALLGVVAIVMGTVLLFFSIKSLLLGG